MGADLRSPVLDFWSGRGGLCRSLPPMCPSCPQECLPMPSRHPSHIPMLPGALLSAGRGRDFCSGIDGVVQEPLLALLAPPVLQTCLMACLHLCWDPLHWALGWNLHIMQNEITSCLQYKVKLARILLFPLWCLTLVSVKTESYI